MAIKTTATSLIMAALAVVGDYSVAEPAVKPVAAQVERPALQVRRAELRRVLEDLRTGFLELDDLYGQALQVTLKRDCFDAELFERLPELIAQARGLEAALRGVEVPDYLSEEHMGLRRAVARMRGRLVQLESLLIQTHETPRYVESSIDMDGLKALAEHTTQRLARLA
ncbi:conserved hypothetical protein [Pseudomonas sp. OF001]|uniref:hypothetical protein n=1 Tax=Pseudomonas sp. OF001 TaxID=2772300 RepID=UPI00191998C4|nr:hypothetical protein [Pseudomonas sp. OF001]CAD5377126.1 conserved hypothetical protein [Pseudomonas sp. OF001]